MLLLIIYAIAAILFSFLCSIWEAVLLSISPSYIQHQKGTSIGKSLDKFKENIDKPLSAILTLNTIAHTVGAILVGAQAAHVFNGEVYLGVSGELIVSVIMTLGILILSEIIPKTIGASYWQKLAPFTVKSINILLVILAPLIWVTQLFTSRFKGGHGSVLSRADFLAMKDLAHQTGKINKNESKVISNMLKLKDMQVTHVMTPATIVVSAHPDKVIEEFYNENSPIKFSRIPVWDKEQNDIIGMVLKDDLLETLALGKIDLKMKDIAKKIHFVNHTSNLESVLNHLVENNIHMALVTDEFGNIVGLVSLEDLLETILGIEITDETDSTSDLQALARKKWEKRAKSLGILKDLPENSEEE
ncbi:MAG: hemolysin family protein [Flavobacteriales bacterium]|jgi:CBS domain containing-hemolysin-like protein|nr:hemolysin family protein [Flavobacteriales bacterium]